jgi:hypothetical protein
MNILCDVSPAFRAKAYEIHREMKKGLYFQLHFSLLPPTFEWLRRIIGYSVAHPLYSCMLIVR